MARFDPTGVKLEELKITSANGKSIDIEDLLVGLSFEESLFESTLIGGLVLTDATGLLANLPVIGQETIDFAISKGPTYKRYKFRTAGVNSQVTHNSFTTTYALQLVQESYFQDSTKLISQSFNGTMSDIIKSIYTDTLLVDEADLDIEDSKGVYKFVAPRWSPYATIKWCARRAVDGDDIPMMCYNTLNDGRKLKSFTTLFAQTPVERYTQNASNPSTSSATSQSGDFADYDGRVKTPFRFTALSTGPTGQSIVSGAYASRNMVLDIATRTYREVRFNYRSLFDKLPHLAQHPMLDDGIGFDVDSPDTTSTTFITSGGAHGPSAIGYADRSVTISPLIRSYINSLDNYSYRLSVSGRFDLHAGSLVDLEIHKNRLTTYNDPDDALDQRRSGKHIILNLKHVFNRRDSRIEYTIDFDCGRDTMEKATDERV
jgi:hypothetical protein